MATAKKQPTKQQLNVIQAGSYDTLFDNKKVAESLAKESAVLLLHIRQPGFRKRLPTKNVVAQEEIESGLDTDIIYVSQDTIDRREIKELSSHRSRFISWIKELSIKNGMLANGLYLVPVSLVETIDKAIKTFIEERNQLLDSFQEKYDDIKEKAREKRGKHFDITDYPPFEQIRSQYKVESFVLSFNVPAALLNQNKKLHQQEAQKIEMMWKDTAVDVQDALRQSFKDYVGHLADRLGVDDATGKRKKFNEKRITDLQNFLSTFNARNLTGDAELETLAKQAAKLIEGVDVAELRSDEALRDSLERGFNQLKEMTDGLIITPGRKFKLDGE